MSMLRTVGGLRKWHKTWCLRGDGTCRLRMSRKTSGWSPSFCGPGGGFSSLTRVMCVEFALSCLTLLWPVNAAAQQAADSQQAPPRIVVDVNRVLVPVVVRDKQGRIVTDLKKEDFQVFDDDKPHPILGLTVEKREVAERNTASNATGGTQSPTPANSASPSSTLPKRI